MTAGVLAGSGRSTWPKHPIRRQLLFNCATIRLGDPSNPIGLDIKDGVVWYDSAKALDLLT